MEWLGSNPNATIEAIEKGKAYFNYNTEKQEKTTYKASGFKKIIYKNLYQNIDLEYIFHEKKGTKYSLIVHPGGDLSRVKMRYKGGELTQDKSGNLVIKTKLGDIIDHAPISYEINASNHVVPSRFEVSENTVGFQVSNYNKTKDFVVDPWTVTPITDITKAFKIESDPQGNTYIYAGASDGFLRLQKRDKDDGSLIWNTETNLLFMIGMGDLAVDKVGNSYVSDNSSNIKKYKPDGSFEWNSSGGGGALGIPEHFLLKFNPANDTLYVAGSGAGAYISYVNINSGAVTGVTSYNACEIKSFTVDKNGKLYGLTCNGCFGPQKSRILATDSKLTQLYNTISYFGNNNSFNYFDPSYINGSPASLGNQNGIAADGCEYIYTYNGGTLAQNDINNGLLTTTIVVAEGRASNNSGVIVDSCGYVYVGTRTGINKYDKNLNLVKTVSTGAAVYDICLGINNEILASGNGFVGAYSDLSYPCNAQTITIAMSSTPSLNNDGTATATATGGNEPYRYEWSNGGSKATIDSLPKGIYTVTVTSQAEDCTVLTKIDSITVTDNIEPIIILPNIFTPNGDGKYDLFTIDTKGVSEVLVTIYNRWGQKVGKVDRIDGNWDGKTLEGSLAPSGVYYYNAEAKSADGKKATKEGFFTLLR